MLIYIYIYAHASETAMHFCHIMSHVSHEQRVKSPWPKPNWRNPQQTLTRLRKSDEGSIHNTLKFVSVSTTIRSQSNPYFNRQWCILDDCYTALEASWRRVFDPCTPLLFDLYHYLEQNGYFWLVPEHTPGPSSQVLPSCRVRHPYCSMQLFVRFESLSRLRFPGVLRLSWR